MRLKRSSIALVATLLLIFSHMPAALADDDGEGDMVDWLKVNHMHVSPTNCEVSSTINLNRFTQDMDDIRNDWLVKDNATDFYKKHALIILYSVALHKVGGVLLNSVYSANASKSPDRCHFQFYLKTKHNYENNKNALILTWDIDKATESKINWNSWDDQSLPQIAMNYQFTGTADQLLQNSGESNLPR